MKKVVYSISRLSRFGNNKMTGVGFITESDLVIACVSQKGNPYKIQFSQRLSIILPPQSHQYEYVLSLQRRTQSTARFYRYAGHNPKR